MIPFNNPFAPPVAEYESYIRDIWKRGWFTNNSVLVQRLESDLREYLGLPDLLFTCNGTVALQLAIRALDLRGEIITTPFSYVATTSSIVWQGCKPVFADIDARTLNIDPDKIEAKITSRTSAILATHVFGNPCDVEAIAEIAVKHNLRVIYDAAHCFGTTYKGESVFRWGDISITSFHATKLFHTIEGGAVITSSPELSQKVDLMRNFGHNGPGNFSGVGINGKNSEVHAAMGLCNLKYADELLSRRKKLAEKYDELLVGINPEKPEVISGAVSNRAYYPVIFPNEATLLDIQNGLEEAGIETRRYFYPSLSKLEYAEQEDTPVADRIASGILCLPLYHTLGEDEVEHIASTLIKLTKKQYAL